MRKLAYGAFAASGLSALLLGLAGPAVAAPVEVESATDTINRLQSEGFTVILEKVGTGALDDCTVAAVRPGTTYTRTDSGIPGAHSGMENTIGELTLTELSKTVYVDLKC